jgi:hypothetical protein
MRACICSHLRAISSTSSTGPRQPRRGTQRSLCPRSQLPGEPCGRAPLPLFAYASAEVDR